MSFILVECVCVLCFSLRHSLALALSWALSFLSQSVSRSIDRSNMGIMNGIRYSLHIEEWLYGHSAYQWFASTICFCSRFFILAQFVFNQITTTRQFFENAFFFGRENGNKPNKIHFKTEQMITVGNLQNIENSDEIGQMIDGWCNCNFYLTIAQQKIFTSLGEKEKNSPTFMWSAMNSSCM